MKNIKMRKITSVLLIVAMLLGVMPINLTNKSYAGESEAKADNVPRLNVFPDGNSAKIEWAMEMDDTDVIYEIGFEEDDELPIITYNAEGNRKYGGQSFTEEDKYSGKRSLKIVDTYTNGNYKYINLHGDISYSIYSAARFLDRKYMPNGTDLSVSFRAKTSGSGNVELIGVGSAADFGTPLKNHYFLEKVNIGDRVVKVNNPTYFKKAIDSGARRYLANQKGAYSYIYVTDVNIEDSTITMSGPFQGEFEEGDNILLHNHRNPVVFSNRSFQKEDGWELFNINTKVIDYADYDTLKRGFVVWISTTTHDTVYIDDLKFGYATKAELFRGDTKLYEGFLSDYHDKDAKDTVSPDKVKEANAYIEDGNAVLEITRPEDYGNKYTYQVNSLNHQGGRTPSEVKEVDVVTGVKGYSYVLDKNPNTEPNNRINETSDIIKAPINTNDKYYLHVKAIDGAGNASETTHYEFQDNVAPKLHLTVDNKELTNKDVVITAEATDDASGVDFIKLPDGRDVKVSKVTFNAEENGTYKFTAIDKAGNTKTEEITVSNIDKVPVVITIEDYIKAPTNKDIIVNASVNKGTLNKESHTFTENGSFTFTAEDEAGNKDEVTVKITNIDKVVPTKPKLSYVKDKFILTEAVDLESGIHKHMYSVNNETFKEWTKNLIANSFEDGAYDIRVKAVDKATNESEVGTFKVTLRYQEAERKTSKAESTLTREDYNSAKEVVDTLNPGDIKDDLLQRLKDVLHEIIKKEFEDLVDGSEGEEDLKDAEEQIKDSDLSEEDKNDLLDKLNNKAIELATRAVELAEAMRREPYIGGAIVLVDKITPCEEKTTLEDRIAAIKEVREGQLGAIDSNEENYELKNAELDVKQAEALKREPFLTKAKVNVAHLPDSEEKAELEARLEALNQLLEGNSEEAIKGAERAVAQAEAIKREANLNSAKAVVDRLKASTEKDNFLARLQAVEDYINEQSNKEEPDKPANSDTQIKRAEDAVKLAERYKRDAFINQARQAVERLKDSEEKTMFLERLDAIK